MSIATTRRRLIALKPLATDVTVVANYSAFPPANMANGQFYWATNSQGTYWLPGELGGTYYPIGLYYSNGVTWTHMETPYQATQAAVNAGLITDQFVTPNTLYNFSGISPIVGASLTANQNVYINASGKLATSTQSMFIPSNTWETNLGGVGLSIDNTFKQLSFGDYNFAGNGTYFSLDDNTQNVTINAVTFDLNGLVRIPQETQTPLITGGTAVGSGITFKSTTGNGTTTGLAHQFTGGNNGATTIASLYNDGQFLVGTTTRNATSLGITRIVQGSSFIDIGEHSGGAAAIWMGAGATNTASNYTLLATSAITVLNNSTALNFRISNTNRITLSATRVSFLPGPATSGTSASFLYTAPASTGQTAGTESNSVSFDMAASMQHASNTLIETQRDFFISQRTHTFAASGGTITNAATFAISGAPIAGTNAIITNSNALWIQSGATRLDGSLNLAYVAKTANYTIVHGTDYLIDCTSGTFTVTLPTAVGFPGRVYEIVNSGAGTITLTTTSSQTIMGSATQTINPAEAISVMSTGTNWIYF